MKHQSEGVTTFVCLDPPICAMIEKLLRDVISAFNVIPRRSDYTEFYYKGSLLGSRMSVTRPPNEGQQRCRMQRGSA